MNVNNINNLKSECTSVQDNTTIRVNFNKAGKKVSRLELQQERHLFDYSNPSFRHKSRYLGKCFKPYPFRSLIEYDDSGNIILYSDSEDVRKYYTYDDSNRLIGIKNTKTGFQESTVYNEHGKTVYLSNPNGSYSKTSFDLKGRRTFYQNENKEMIRTIHHDNGNFLKPSHASHTFNISQTPYGSNPPHTPHIYHIPHALRGLSIPEDDMEDSTDENSFKHLEGIGICAPIEHVTSYKHYSSSYYDSHERVIFEGGNYIEGSDSLTRTSIEHTSASGKETHSYTAANGIRSVRFFDADKRLASATENGNRLYREYY